MHQMGHSRCHRWAVVLAGGDGQRLQPLTRSIAGDDRPKQFCAVVGGQTPSRLAPLRRTLMAPTKTHECFYLQQLHGTSHSRLIIQPDNRGTVPAILYSLMCLHNIDARAVDAFFPSDHHFSDHAAFLDHMKIAFQAAGSHPGSVVLLGAKAATPESGYGWIEPGDVVENCLPGPCDASRVFGKSPILRAASALMNRGCLWNTFVMAGCIKAFLNVIRLRDRAFIVRGYAGFRLKC